VFIAGIQATLHFPGAFSLKDRRQELESLKRRLIQKHGASVKQVGEKDKWQIATLTIALACESEGEARQRAEAVHRELESGYEYELSSFELTLY
jgi:uncharacterized protein